MSFVSVRFVGRHLHLATHWQYEETLRWYFCFWYNSNTHASTQQIEKLKTAIAEASRNPDFIHHKWFMRYHLEIVQQIAVELLDFYPAANVSLVRVLAWIHDYGKIIDFDNQYDTTLTEGVKLLESLGFEKQFIETVMEYMSILDKKLELDIHEAPLEVQIVSSADGCAHFVGPFMYLWWYENPTKRFEELMQDNIKKAEKDWNRKIVLPEARKAFEQHHAFILQQSGVIPTTYLH